MIEKRFCNYNKHYQQRLGFLKVVCRVGQGSRGGPDDMLERLKDLYPELRRRPTTGRNVDDFDPGILLRAADAPSWSVGFVPKTLDRLVLWAEMVGLIAPSGRLSEWANILQGVRKQPNESTWSADNPFELSVQERAFFVQLLFYHDQVLPRLVMRIGECHAGDTISTSDARFLVVESLGEMLDSITGNAPDEMQQRMELRDVLERIGRDYRLSDPRQLANAGARKDILKRWRSEGLKGERSHLMDYHTITRFEQLTDLGLVSKEDPASPSATDEEKENTRTSWSWYVCPGLPSTRELLERELPNLETFFQQSWMDFCALALGRRTRLLDAFRDQMTIASLLDDTLPQARRQLGPVQVHTWGSLACLRALSQGKRLELKTITRLLEAMRADARTSNAVRLSGRSDLRGRTASVPKTGLAELLQEHEVREEERND